MNCLDGGRIRSFQVEFTLTEVTRLHLATGRSFRLIVFVPIPPCRRFQSSLTMMTTAQNRGSGTTHPRINLEVPHPDISVTYHQGSRRTPSATPQRNCPDQSNDYDKNHRPMTKFSQDIAPNFEKLLPIDSIQGKTSSKKPNDCVSDEHPNDALIPLKT
jgi:hypothetical protein